jgi:glycerophosphoryl diester phosphodiesterase
LTAIIAHRGNSRAAPENTLSAIRAAIDIGARLIEVDVRCTQDGVLVLLHDRTVQRTTNGRGAIDQLRWHDVQRLEVRGPNGLRDGIPTLDAALAEVVAADATLVLEAKAPRRATDMMSGLLKSVDGAAARQRVIFSSFDKRWLRELGRAEPDLKVNELRVWSPVSELLARASIVSVFWPAVLLDPTVVRRLHRTGRQVWAWTVDQSFAMRLMQRRGVDGIITSDPRLCQRILSRSAARGK